MLNASASCSNCYSLACRRRRERVDDSVIRLSVRSVEFGFCISLCHCNFVLTFDHCHVSLQGITKADLFDSLMDYIAARAQALEEAELVYTRLFSKEQILR